MPRGGQRPSGSRTPAPDSRVPSERWLRATNGQFEGMDVKVVPVPGKGLGLVAQVDMKEGVLFAYYLVMLYKEGAHIAQSSYLLSSGVRGHVLDLFDGSFPAPGPDGIPYVAALVNEPEEPFEDNCKLVPEPLDDEDGSVRRYGLRTTRPILQGEELVWDYGPEYGKRSYPSKYD